MGAPARSTPIHHPDCTQDIHPALIAGRIINYGEAGYSEFATLYGIDEISGSDPFGGTCS